MFPILWMKLQQHKALKLTKMIFLGKNLEVFMAKMPKIGPKGGFSSFMKNRHVQFFRFLHKVTVSYRLVIDPIERFWKKKWPDMGPKGGFSGMIESQSMEIF